ncbi:hypothetical protein [Micromonospora sp. HM5-17]|jgi:hypothetical protein|uniref:hypothetical protein n=1 Tax=Micromonospora sp. HM5-17 TaxID=2487710 RepID=UPI0018F367B1|nr:hypothetical protein [Micromonospora sp. HM5-17]
MRHIGTVVYALVMTPLVWFLLAAGQDRSAREFATILDSGGNGGRLVLPALTLAAAGVLLGLASALRFSPLGAVLAGAFLVIAGLGPLTSPQLLNLLDRDVAVAGRTVDLSVPVRTGTALALGSLLLVGAASVQRWRRWPKPEPEPSPSDGESGTAESDRPLGADGLGLPIPNRSGEPVSRRADDTGWPDATDWTNDTDPTGTTDRTDPWRAGSRPLAGGALAPAHDGDDRDDEHDRAVPPAGWTPRARPSTTGIRRP